MLSQGELTTTYIRKECLKIIISLERLISVFEKCSRIFHITKIM